MTSFGSRVFALCPASVDFSSFTEMCQAGRALSSLYSLFATSRDILKKYGASVARPKNGTFISFGYLAVAILNTVIRPVLAKWHPLLLDYEIHRENNVSAMEHEKSWERAEELRQALNNVRFVLIEYADLLAKVADVPLLIIER